MAFTYPTFDGLSFSPFWLQISDPEDVPYAVRFSPSGVKHCSIANHTSDILLTSSGTLTSAQYETLRGKIGDEGTLTASQGSCTAILTSVRRLPRSGDAGGGAHLVDVSITWIKKTDWV